MSEFLVDKELADELLAHANALVERHGDANVFKNARASRIDLDDHWSLQVGRSKASLEKLMRGIIAAEFVDDVNEKTDFDTPFDQATIMMGDDERTRILAVGEGLSLETAPESLEDLLNHPGVEGNAPHCTLQVGQIALLDVEFTVDGERARLAENFIALSVANQFLSHQ